MMISAEMHEPKALMQAPEKLSS